MNFIVLENKDNSKIIKDVVMHPLKINKDESGTLTETLRKDWQDVYGSEKEFAMQYCSVTDSGIARDENVWHVHPTSQIDRFLVVSGEIVTAVADSREGSETEGLLNLFHMRSAENPYMILIPRGTLHGFMTVSKESAILLNFPTQLYNPVEEGRVPYEEANVKFEDGSLFSWDLVRKEFPDL